MTRTTTKRWKQIEEPYLHGYFVRTCGHTIELIRETSGTWLVYQIKHSNARIEITTGNYFHCLKIANNLIKSIQ